MSELALRLSLRKAILERLVPGEYYSYAAIFQILNGEFGDDINSILPNVLKMIVELKEVESNLFVKM